MCMALGKERLKIVKARAVMQMVQREVPQCPFVLSMFAHIGALLCNGIFLICCSPPLEKKKVQLSKSKCVGHGPCEQEKNFQNVWVMGRVSKFFFFSGGGAAAGAAAAAGAGAGAAAEKKNFYFGKKTFF